jgi:hypothetical protein
MPYNFTEDDAVKSNWFKFNNIGDSIQGTLIGRKVSQNRLRNNEDQNVYELKVESGEVWNIGGKKAIDQMMRGVKLGQIVEFKLVEIREPKIKGHNATKIIKVFARPDVVDKEWLLEQESMSGADNGDGYSYQEEPSTPYTGTTTPAPADPVQEAMDAITGAPTPADTLAMILNLGGTKFGLTDQVQIQTEIMKRTGLAFMEQNYTKILELLKAM